MTESAGLISLTPCESAVLDQARHLSGVLEESASAPALLDEVAILAADLLEAHADTGIELDMWPCALDLVMNYVLAGERTACSLPPTSRGNSWFTVIGTWTDAGPQPLAVVTGRQAVDTAVGVWQRQVSAANRAEAARLSLA